MLKNCTTFLLVINGLFYSCNSKAQVQVSALPKEILQNITDSIEIGDPHTLHISGVEITDKIIVAQTTDKETRQQNNIFGYDLNKKKELGFFPWPDPQNNFYFGIALYEDFLLYFSNYQYFRKVNFYTKKVDTIPIRSNVSELVDMVVVKDKIYSLGNIYGIDIVDLNNTVNQIFKRNYRGHYYNEQNNLSLPISDDLNLVASCEIDSNQYALYAIDSNMTIKWTKVIQLQNRLVQITSLNMKDGFLLKYDNNLVLLSKKDGSEKWRSQFDLNVFSMFKVNDEEVLLNLSKNSNGNELLPGADTGFNKIIKYNLKDKTIAWQVEKIKDDGKRIFLLKNTLYSIIDDNHMVQISVKTGKSNTFPFDIRKTFITVIRDKKTGEDYLFSGNKLYW
jgi:hypothetical protein